MEPSVQSICNLLARTRLMRPAEVRSMFLLWLNHAQGAVADVARFRQWLLANRYVNDYQVDRLFRGKPDHYFLNQYTILGRIGVGRMAGIFKAQHQLGQVVAIKVLPPSRARDPQWFARFHREARLALRLNHPHVVRTFHTGESEGLFYLVMEYLEGETLQEVLQRRSRLPPAEAVRLVHQALLGLQHIHEQSLAHRDLSPENLMLVPLPAPGQPDTTLQATVKILDIGLGREVFDDEAPSDAHGLTREGTILGTPEYMAPEQARNAHGADIRSDIYSLGCVLYHALAGQPPFSDKNAIRLLVRHATDTPAPLTQLNPDVPDGLQKIVNWMMARDPAQRYPTPDRAAQALQVYLASGSDAAATDMVPPGMEAYLKWLGTTIDAPAPGAPAAAPASPPPRPQRAPAAAVPPAVSVQSLCNRLVRERLLPPEQVRSLYPRWLQEAGTAAADPAGFLKWLVGKQCLTDYQAAVLGGRSTERLWIGPCKVLARIAQGRLAGVYQASHSQGQVVALKVLPPSRAADPNLLARFQREARLAMRLQHPHIARTFQAGEDNGLHYLILEYLHGETLREVLGRRGRLPAGEAVRLLYQALQGLQHIHEQGVIHRDLEPGNLMLVAEGTAPAASTLQSKLKILDIGLGRALFDEGSPGVADAVTGRGELLGTPEYRAPEQVRDAHAADIRADIYSLGCVLYHALTGQPPFIEKNPLRLMLRHAQETPTPLQAFRLQEPSGLQRILDAMLAKDPVRRYSTPAEAARELLALRRD